MKGGMQHLTLGLSPHAEIIYQIVPSPAQPGTGASPGDAQKGQDCQCLGERDCGSKGVARGESYLASLTRWPTAWEN